MPMRMRMRLAPGVASRVWMLMVRVVRVGMLVFGRLVPVFVLVPFGKVQPDANAHEQRRDAESRGEGVTQEHKRLKAASGGPGLLRRARHQAYVPRPRPEPT